MVNRCLLLLVIIAGCADTPPESADASHGHKPAVHATSTPPVNPPSSSLPPENVNERVAALKEAGFSLRHKYDDFVQYSRGTLIVDLDLDDDGIHVTPIDESQTELTEETLESVYRIYDMLGVPVRDLTYHVTPANSKIGPEKHTTRIRGWEVEKSVWPEGVSGMFVAFSVEKSPEQ